MSKTISAIQLTQIRIYSDRLRSVSTRANGVKLKVTRADIRAIEIVGSLPTRRHRLRPPANVHPLCGNVRVQNNPLLKYWVVGLTGQRIGSVMAAIQLGPWSPEEVMLMTRPLTDYVFNEFRLITR